MRNYTDLNCSPSSPLRYHIELVRFVAFGWLLKHYLLRLMALCTRGKNSIAELKSASFMPMDHIVRVVRSESCIIDVKSVYLQVVILQLCNHPFILSVYGPLLYRYRYRVKRHEQCGVSGAYSGQHTGRHKSPEPPTQTRSTDESRARQSGKLCLPYSYGSNY